MTRRRAHAPLILLGPLIAAAAGCGKPPPAFAPVEGTVKLHGRPADRVVVKFYATGETRGPLATGWTDAAGKYRLKAATGEDGAVVGTYIVCLGDRAEEKNGPRAEPHPDGKGLPAAAMPHVGAKSAPGKENSKAAGRRFPVSFVSPGTSPLRAEVNSGPQTLDFSLP